MKEEGLRFGRARIIAVLMLIGVFLAGAIAGIAADRVLIGSETAGGLAPQDRFQRRPPPGRSGAPGEPRRSMAVMLQRRLDLTDEQREQVEAVFEARRVRTEAILRDFEPRLQTQRDSADMEIRRILTAEQVELFDRMIGPRWVVPSFRRPGGRSFDAPVAP